MNQKEYILATGTADYQRLMILSRLYNPGAIAFMKQMGLKPGMKVLEIGCGTGHMAVELAKVVGDQGVVFASDNDAAQLELTQATAEHAGIKNIKCLKLDLTTDLSQYQGQFDFIYGRWVIEWTKGAAKRILKELFQTLKPGGTLVYESINLLDTGLNGYPDPTMPKINDAIIKKVWAENHMDEDFIKAGYFLLKDCGATETKMAINQVVLQTPEEKSVFRLGMLSAEKFLKDKIMSDQEFDEIVKGYQNFEASENIASFFRNYLLAAKR